MTTHAIPLHSAEQNVREGPMVFASDVPERIEDFADFISGNYLVARSERGTIAAYYNYRLYISHDHGRSWFSREFPLYRFFDVQLAGEHCLALWGSDSCETYCAGMNVLYLSSDRGQTWKEVDFPGYRRVELFGLVSCTLAYIETTRQHSEPPVKDDEFPVISLDPDGSEDSKYFTREVFVTRDGGRNWKSVAPGTAAWRTAWAHLR